ncbi:hypothetical protein P3T21_005880 [Paraburkholderia sp. GAS334]|jgi:hypothetical protein
MVDKTRSISHQKLLVIMRGVTQGNLHRSPQYKDNMTRTTLTRLRPLIASILLFATTTSFSYQASPPGTPDEANLSSHNTYQNHDGATVHAPARSLSGAVPEGASARCRDGTYSFSRHHSGTCSRHGGVADWL